MTKEEHDSAEKHLFSGFARSNPPRLRLRPITDYKSKNWAGIQPGVGHVGPYFNKHKTCSHCKKETWTDGKVCSPCSDNTSKNLKNTTFSNPFRPQKFTTSFGIVSSNYNMNLTPKMRYKINSDVYSKNHSSKSTSTSAPSPGQKGYSGPTVSYSSLSSSQKSALSSGDSNSSKVVTSSTSASSLSSMGVSRVSTSTSSGSSGGSSSGSSSSSGTSSSSSGSTTGGFPSFDPKTATLDKSLTEPKTSGGTATVTFTTGGSPITPKTSSSTAFTNLNAPVTPDSQLTQAGLAAKYGTTVVGGITYVNDSTGRASNAPSANGSSPTQGSGAGFEITTGGNTLTGGSSGGSNKHSSGSGTVVAPLAAVTPLLTPVAVTPLAAAALPVQGAIPPPRSAIGRWEWLPSERKNSRGDRMMEWRMVYY